MEAELPTVLEDVKGFDERPRNAKYRPKYSEAQAWGLLCHWLWRCARLKLAPPVELAEAMYILAGKHPLPGGTWSEERNCRPENAGAWRKAAAYEAREPEDPKHIQPSTASTNKLSQITGVSRDTIRRWRKRPLYRDYVHWQRLVHDPKTE